MGKKLFRVDVELSLFCWAESEEEAHRNAAGYAEEELSNDNADIYATEVDLPSNPFPADWLGGIPYGDADDPEMYDKTVGEVRDVLWERQAVVDAKRAEEAATPVLPGIDPPQGGEENT